MPCRGSQDGRSITIDLYAANVVSDNLQYEMWSNQIDELHTLIEFDPWWIGQKRALTAAW